MEGGRRGRANEWVWCGVVDKMGGRGVGGWHGKGGVGGKKLILGI